MDQLITERFLSEIWRRQLLGVQFVTEKYKRQIEVIYPGRRNTGSGPDFTKAIIRIDGVIEKGDIEIHVDDFDWKAHGHQTNPEYNDLILHVVWNGTRSIMLQSGKVVVTLSLKPLFGGSIEHIMERLKKPFHQMEFCYKAHEYLGDDEIGSLLDELGDERFRLKASNFARCINRGNEGQSLYEGMMTALGYAKNKIQFRNLALKIPLQSIERIYHDSHEIDYVRSIERRLLYVAGLYGENVLELANADGLIPMDKMSATEWRLFRVRPENHPVRRIAGIARLLSRSMKYGGLLNYVISHVSESDGNNRLLENRFMVVQAVGKRNDKWSSLIGRSRAREIVINIVLPFIFTWAQYHLDKELEQKAIMLYQNCSKTHDYAITRGVQHMLIPRSAKIMITGQRQQGLLHLVKKFCLHRRCTDCPLYKRMVSRTSYSINNTDHCYKCTRQLQSRDTLAIIQ